MPFDNHHCQKDEDADHPCGHHRVETAASLVMGALLAKELLFRCRLSVAQRVRPSMPVANAWHARSDAASSLVVGIGIAGSLAGSPIPEPTAAAFVGFRVAKMGRAFGRGALHDLMDRSIDAVAARDRVLQRHRLLNLMTHAGPWRRPDLDHVAALPQAQR